MPIQSQWLLFSDRTVDSEKDQGGVYELGDSVGMVVYLGGSKSLRRRLKEDLAEPSMTCIKRNARVYRTEYNMHYIERMRKLYDEHVKTYGEPPLCNNVRL
jgi:hypothetical protein